MLRAEMIGASVFALALAGLVTGASAAVVWDGPTVTFTKPNFADWNLAANQDRITDNVWITRKSIQGIFNIKTEAGYVASSPADTEWADGNAADWESLTFQPWLTWTANSPPNKVGVDAVVHLISDDIYFDIKFLNWTSGRGGGGGGFSYDRSTFQMSDPCDFEPDGDCDIDDIDGLTLVGNLATGVSVPPADAKFDLDASSTVDTGDLNQWLAVAATANDHASPYKAGDNDLDRDIDITDFNTLASNFDPGGGDAGNKFSLGDGDGDGDIDITDFGKLATDFSPGGYFDDDMATAVTTDANPGEVDLIVDLATGEVTLDGNTAAISGLQIFSAGDSLVAADFTADVLQFVISTNTSTYAEGAFVNTSVDGLISLDILYDLLVDAQDLTFEYTMIGQPTVQGTVIYVPEPASLVLVGMGGLMLMQRRCAA